MTDIALICVDLGIGPFQVGVGEGWRGAPRAWLPCSRTGTILITGS